MKPFLCVYGHIALDYILQLDHFPAPNTSVEVVEKKRYFGGTGGNISALASAMGVPTALVSYVGRDFPRDYREFLQERGVILDDVVEVEGEETTTVWIVSDRDHNQIAYVFQGAMRRMDQYPVRIEKAAESSWIHICTGNPLYYIGVMEKCRGMEKRIAFDPAQEIHYMWNRETFRRALQLSDIFFANRSELQRALEYMDARMPEDLLSYVKVIINTRGAEGCIAYMPEGEIHVPPVRSDCVVDTTGAGDAFRAGFYAGLYRGMDFRESVLMGNSLASFVIETRGALSCIPAWEEVVKRARLFTDKNIIHNSSG